MPSRVHMDRRIHSMDQGMEKGEKSSLHIGRHLFGVRVVFEAK